MCRPVEFGEHTLYSLQVRDVCEGDLPRTVYNEQKGIHCGDLENLKN